MLNPVFQEIMAGVARLPEITKRATVCPMCGKAYIGTPVVNPSCTTYVHKAAPKFKQCTVSTVRRGNQ